MKTFPLLAAVLATAACSSSTTQNVSTPKDASTIIGDCHVQDGYFHVLADGKVYTQRLAAAAVAPRWRCSSQAAAVYDGDYFYVFNSEKLSFSYENVENDYGNALLSVAGTSVTLYDGDYWYAYDPAKDHFDYQNVESYAHSLLTASPTTAALYDGDYLYTYDASERKFRYQNVENQYAGAGIALAGDLLGFFDGDYLYVYDGAKKAYTYVNANDKPAHAWLTVADGGVLFYDGDYAHSFCRAQAKFDYENVDNEVAARGSISGNLVTMRVGSTYVNLDTATCKLDTTSAR